VEACLESNPRRILDLCCGTGDLAIGISKTSAYPVRVTGLDLNAQMLDVARQKAMRAKATTVEFIQGDAGAMPFTDGEFDCLIIGFGFRNLTFENTKREQHLQEINRVMKRGAQLLILESARPESRFINFLYRLYLKLFLVPLGGLLSGDWNAYRYLANSSAGFYSFAEMRKMLDANQLSLHTRRKYILGSVNLLIAKKN